jgi:hypothetical protein
MRQKKQGDIDSTYHAIRARLKALTATGGSAPTTVAPHGHAASAISFEETQSDSSGYLAADDVQEALEELDSEKLARSGVQPMLGSLDMDHHDVNNILNAEVEVDASVGNDLTVGNDIIMTGGFGYARLYGVRQIEMVGDLTESDINGVRDITFEGTTVGEGVIDNPRVIHMTGLDGDNEGRIDGLERTVFNLVPTAGVIQDPSAIQFNPNVAQATDQVVQEGVVGWDTLEETLVVTDEISSGILDRYPVGWVIFRCQDGSGA